MELKFIKHVAQTGDKIINGKLIPLNKPKGVKKEPESEKKPKKELEEKQEEEPTKRMESAKDFFKKKSK